jgi:hypothetical protein
MKRVEIKSIKKRILKLLMEKPHLRDDDQKLIANVWFQDLLIAHIEPEKITGYELLDIFSKNEIMSNPESIRRVRQKAQEEHVELRGSTWKNRHKNEEVIKKELGYNTK